MHILKLAKKKIILLIVALAMTVPVLQQSSLHAQEALDQSSYHLQTSTYLSPVKMAPMVSPAWA